MNYTLQNPIGIDKAIQDVQTSVYEAISSLWGTNIDFYGRLYNNPKKIGRPIPEWYNPEKKDYEQVYYDDSKTAVCCFVVSDESTTEDEFLYFNNAKLVFMVDLSKAYNNSDYRNDSEAKRDAIEAVRNSNFNIFRISSLDTNVDNVFSGYNVENLSALDYHPYVVFSINFRLSFYINDKCE